MSEEYRVTCSLAPNWSKAPHNRHTKGRAENLLAKVSKGCPGTHKIERIEDNASDR